MKQRFRRLIRAFGRDVPLHAGNGYAPFFIIGSGRSGNTLMRRILDAHPDIHIPPETYVLKDIIASWSRVIGASWGDLVYLTCAHFELGSHHDEFGHSVRLAIPSLLEIPKARRSLAAILDGIYRFHGAKSGKPPKRWGDKTPLNTFYLPAIDSVFPDARYINMVRDGVDVAVSYVQSKLQPDLRSAAERWKKSIHAAQDFARRHADRVMEVRYESLVTDTTREVTRVCTFIGVDFIPSMIAETSHLPSMVDVTRLGHHQKVREPISVASIGAGRRVISEADAAMLSGLIADDLRALGYPEIRVEAKGLLCEE